MVGTSNLGSWNGHWFVPWVQPQSHKALVFPVAKFAGQQNFAELLGSFEIRSSVDLRNISGFIEDGAPNHH